VGVSLTAAALQDSLPVPAQEVRALWVLRSSLETRPRIASMIAAARTNGFNTLLVQVRGRGDAYYRSSLEPRAASLRLQPPEFDPLREVLSAAYVSGLRVHAWVNVNLVSSAAELPASRDHLIYRHPEWLMVPRQLAAELRTVTSESPEFVGRLARWTRSQSSELEGLYASPVSPESSAHVVAVVSELVANYALDGVHLDYARYPTDDFDYSPAALAAFRSDVTPLLSEVDRRRLDLQMQTDATAYADAFPDRWREFRLSRLNALIMRIRTAVKKARPGIILSAALWPSADEAVTRRLQDWRSWAENGLLDVLCPMAYTQDAATFRGQLEVVRRLAGLRPVWAGIGAYRLSSSQTVENIQTARRLGVDGIILFSYDSLTSPPNGSRYLTEVARAAFGQ
jgi:uncharacterized lipoprotein YddW (UPF0748 family)